MSSLNRRHQAAELLRQAAKMRLEREAAASAARKVVVDEPIANPIPIRRVASKPTLHLFKNAKYSEASDVPHDAHDGTG